MFEAGGRRRCLEEVSAHTLTLNLPAYLVSIAGLRALLYLAALVGNVVMAGARL